MLGRQRLAIDLQIAVDRINATLDVFGGITRLAPASISMAT
jgi:hypothetical protein